MGLSPGSSGMLATVSGERLHLMGVDAELDLVIEVDVAVSGLENGACVVQARLVTDIVRSLEPGAVAFDSDSDEARIASGRSQFGVRTYSADEFPRLPALDEPTVRLPTSDLAEALRQVVRAASSDDAKQPIWGGILLAVEDSELQMVATDTYRLAVRQLAQASGLEEGLQVVVPARALSELQRLLGAPGGSGGSAPEVLFGAGEMFAHFEAGDVQLTTRLIKGEFPNYRHLVPPSYPNHLVVSKEALIDALRRMRLLVRDHTTSVRMAMGADGVELSATNPDLGRASESVDAKYEGSDLTVAFNPSFFIDGAEVVRGEEVVVETVDAAKPAMIRAVDGDDFRYLIMPVRIS